MAERAQLTERLVGHDRDPLLSQRVRRIETRAAARSVGEVRRLATLGARLGLVDLGDEARIALLIAVTRAAARGAVGRSRPPRLEPPGLAALAERWRSVDWRMLVGDPTGARLDARRLRVADAVADTHLAA